MSKPVEIELPAGDAREDEREIEKIADRVQNSEPIPGRAHDLMSIPLTATDESGKSKTIVAPDGSPVGMQGEVITSLTAEQSRHEQMRILKPCLSCAQSFMPRKDSEEWQNREAHVQMARKWGAAHPNESSLEYLGCRALNMWVHASQTCPADRPFLHVYKKGWLASLRAFVARRRAARRVAPS